MSRRGLEQLPDSIGLRYAEFGVNDESLMPVLMRSADVAECHIRPSDAVEGVGAAQPVVDPDGLGQRAEVVLQAFGGGAQVGQDGTEDVVAVDEVAAAGPAIGGVLLGLTDLRTVLLIDAATFAVSAALIGGIRGGTGDKPAAAEPFRTILRSGLEVVRTSNVVRAVSLGMLTTVIFAAMMNVALVPLGRTELHVDEATIGLLSAAFGAGMVLGPLGLVRYGGSCARSGSTAWLLPAWPVVS